MLFWVPGQNNALAAQGFRRVRAAAGALPLDYAIFREKLRKAFDLKQVLRYKIGSESSPGEQTVRSVKALPTRGRQA